MSIGFFDPITPEKEESTTKSFLFNLFEQFGCYLNIELTKLNMKNFAKTVSRFLLCERLSDWAKLGLRVFIGFMMLTHGIAKIEQFDTLKSTFPATMGMSSELSLILIILVEVGCSSLVLLGFMTRLAVLPLMFSMIIAAFFTFSPISLSTAELPLLYLGIYTFILLEGPGRYSADAFFVKTFHLETSSESMEEV